MHTSFHTKNFPLKKVKVFGGEPSTELEQKRMGKECVGKANDMQNQQSENEEKCTDWIAK